MNIEHWHTADPPSADFERAWQVRLAAAPLANFSMSVDLLKHEAAQGNHAIAMVVDSNDRHGAIVARETSDGLVSGWPWRWQAVVESEAGEGLQALNPGSAAWLFDTLKNAVGPARVQMFLPHPPSSGVTGHEAGRTILMSVTHDDDTLLAAIKANKRRQLRRAMREGYEVAEAHDPAAYRQFNELQHHVAERHGLDTGEGSSDVEPGSEPWREWDLPWMWLLVATREGCVESGLGSAIQPGGVQEARTSATSEAGRHDGAFALLSHEEAKRCRDRGHLWLNLGGDTVYKRETSGSLGTKLTMHAWLGGGGARGALQNLSQAVLRGRSLHDVGRGSLRRLLTIGRRQS